MKKQLLLLLSTILMTSLFAQQSDLKLYAVRFNDKGINKNSVLNPSNYLSEKSVERRLRHNIAFDQSDLPVNEQYIVEISHSGAKIITRSRWFNTVVVEATPDEVAVFSSNAYVAEVKQINDGLIQKGISDQSKPFFINESVKSWNKAISAKNPNDLYDYGAAYDQINQLHGQYLHNLGFTGKGMTIAVIDAGFNSADVMNCFDSLRANNQIKGTHDFAVAGNNVYATTMNSHGTSVLSCMGANLSGQMIGTAPKADYWLLRSEVDPGESIVEEYYWVSAAEFADSVGADLINSSLGYTTFDNTSTNHTYADMDGNTTFITKGADKAAEKGILVVNSAGNEGDNVWKYIGAPADGDSVFSIGAVDAFGARAYFSSQGPTYDGRIKPTVMAMGYGSAIFYPSGLGSGSGTSFSSPITCGITACLWQAIPQFNNMQIIEEIKRTASRASNPDSLMGWGIPNYQTAYTTLSINSISAEKELYSYPNPVKDQVTIGFPSAMHGKYDIDIYDLHGQLIYSSQGFNETTHSLQINYVSTLPSGIYLIKVTNGTNSYSGKIIKV